MYTKKTHKKYTTITKYLPKLDDYRAVASGRAAILYCIKGQYFDIVSGGGHSQSHVGLLVDNIIRLCLFGRILFLGSEEVKPFYEICLI